MPNPTERMSVYVPFARVDADKREVWGWASTEALAHDGRVLTFDASKDAFEDWLPWGNVREQHDPKKAVGRAVGWKPDEDSRRIYVGAHISDGAEDTWQKVLDQTLRGFSVGGAILEKDSRSLKGTDGIERMVPHVTKYSIDELSLVDRPSDPGAVFAQIIRSADASTALTDVEGTETVVAENGDRLDISGGIARGAPADIDFDQPENVRRDDGGDDGDPEAGDEDAQDGADKAKKGGSADPDPADAEGGEDTQRARTLAEVLPAAMTPHEMIQRMRARDEAAAAALRRAEPKPAEGAGAKADPPADTGHEEPDGDEAKLDEPTVKRSDDGSDTCMRCSGLVRADDKFCSGCGEKVVRVAVSEAETNLDTIRQAHTILTALLVRATAEPDVYDVTQLTDTVQRLASLLDGESLELEDPMSRAAIAKLETRLGEMDGALQRAQTELTELRANSEALERSADTLLEERLAALEGRIVAVESTPLQGPVSRAAVGALEKLLPGDTGQVTSPDDVQRALTVLREAYHGEGADKIDALQAEIDMRDIHRAGPTVFARTTI